MSWIEETEAGVRIIVYNQHGSEVATIFEDGDDWIFDLGVANPGELRISKTDLADPMDWLSAYIGLDIGIEITLDSEEPSHPFLSFVDDETKAVWQVWDVIDGES